MDNQGTSGIAWGALALAILALIACGVLAYKFANVSVIDTIEFKTMQKETRDSYNQTLLPVLHDVVGEIPSPPRDWNVVCAVLKGLFPKRWPSDIYKKFKDDIDRACPPPKGS